MRDKHLVGYQGVLENVRFGEGDTMIEISVNENIPIRAGRVLVVELPHDMGKRWHLIKAVGEAIKRENERD